MSLLTRLTKTLWPRRLARDLEDEVEFHIDMRANEFVKGGMGADDAIKEAHHQFGDVDTVVASMRKERLASSMLFATTAVLMAVVLLWFAQRQVGGDLELPSVRAVSIFKDPNLPTGSPPPPPPPPSRLELGPPWFTFNQQTKTYEAIEKGPGVYSPGRLLDDRGRLINDKAKTR